MSDAGAHAKAGPPDPARARLRQRAIAGVVVFVALAGLIYGAYWLFYARYFQTTDDAYVSGDLVAITSREAGSVLSIKADNTQSVRRGQTLVTLDPSDARIALEAAKSDLAHTIRQVGSLFSKADELRAQILAARAVRDQAGDDYKRRTIARAGGAISGEELAHSRDTLAQAQATFVASESALAQIETQIARTTVATNPDVLASESRLRNAVLQLKRTTITAPVDGVVAQRTVQVGEQIQSGSPLMAVVPLRDVWVDANFKEVQLARMRVGEPVTLSADIYGSGVTYRGHVVGLAAGSGSVFALLPPQNASGNWIKIVQRIPVRIAIDPADLRAHPLRVGLSMYVSVDVRDDSGPLMASQVPGALAAAPDEDTRAEANQMISEILAANAGRP
jgi:membrane fusion protein (multidrug efflux system)